MVVRCLEQTIREKRCSFRDRQLEQSASGAGAANSKSEGKEKTKEIAYNE